MEYRYFEGYSVREGDYVLEFPEFNVTSIGFPKGSDVNTGYNMKLVSNLLEEIQILTEDAIKDSITNHGNEDEEVNVIVHSSGTIIIIIGGIIYQLNNIKNDYSLFQDHFICLNSIIN